VNQTADESDSSESEIFNVYESLARNHTDNAPRKSKIPVRTSKRLQEKTKAYSLKRIYLTVNIDDVVPKNYNEAILSLHADEYKNAMDKEISSMMALKVFEKVLKPQNVRTIGVRWVYSKKKGNIFKARLVAKGYSQIYGQDFQECFAPVADYDSIRLFLSLATSRNLDIYQADVETAFLNGEIEEDLYIECPEGYEHLLDSSEHVLKLKKALYGTKQGARQWSLKFKEVMRTIGFDELISDSSIYIRDKTILLLYVDDILISCEDDAKNEYEKIVRELEHEFKIKSLGIAKTFLGWEIERFNEGIFIHQNNYTKEILQNCYGQSCQILFGAKRRKLQYL